MTQATIEKMLAKYGITVDFSAEPSTVGYHLWNAIKEKGDPLTETEHEQLFDFCWILGNQKRQTNASISRPLKLKFIHHRRVLGRYDMVLIGHIEGGNIQRLIKTCSLDALEEVELWAIFHKLWHRASARDSEEINAILGTYELVEKKKKLLGSIQVLDVACGKNGNGIATLTARYNGKIIGFGIDLDIQQYPSNVKLIQASVKGTLPFEDNFFEIVYSCNFIYYLNKEEVIHLLKEILRVLKPQGFFVFDDNSRGAAMYRDTIIPATGMAARILKSNPHLIIKQ